MTRTAALAALAGVTGLALVVSALRTATARPAAVPDREAWLDGWQALHGGYDPRRSAPVHGWLALVHGAARPLAARGVHPDVLTLASGWVALAVLVPVQAGGRWPLLGALLLVASGLLDAVDGCVAVLQDRTSRWGYLLDSLVDRVSDVAYLVAAVLLGAPGELVTAVGAGVLLLEYARARAGNAGGDDVGTITVAERPTRVIVLAATLLAAGAVPAHAGALATAGAAVLGGFTAVGLGQLLVAVRRALA